MFIFEREREYEWGGAEKEGDTDSEAGSRLWAVSTEPEAVLKFENHNIMTWPKVGHSTDWATQTPLESSLFLKKKDKMPSCGSASNVPWEGTNQILHHRGPDKDARMMM